MTKTNTLILQVLKELDSAGIMVLWPVKLSEYDIHFLFKDSVKSQVLVDFLVEFSSPPDEVFLQVQILLMDGSSNLKASGFEIVLEGLRDILISDVIHIFDAKSWKTHPLQYLTNDEISPRQILGKEGVLVKKVQMFMLPLQGQGHSEALVGV